MRGGSRGAQSGPGGGCLCVRRAELHDDICYDIVQVLFVWVYVKPFKRCLSNSSWFGLLPLFQGYRFSCVV